MTNPLKNFDLNKTKSIWLIPLLAWCVYVTVYFGRINLSITIPFLHSDLGFSNAALGFLATGFFIAYAAGQFINGIIGDRIQVRYFITLGLVVSGLSNIAFRMFPVFPLMLLAWSANGYFQSMLWGPLLRVLAEYVPAAKLYRAMFLMSTSPIIGSFFSYILIGHVAVSFGWGAAFVVPGIVLIAMAVLWYFGAANYTGKTEGHEKKYTTVKNEIAVKRNIMGFIVHSKLYLIIVFGILIGIVREGLVLWGPSIFTDFFSHDMNRMLFIMSLMPLINLFIVTVSGILYKTIMRNENHVIMLFLVLTILSSLLIWRLQNVSVSMMIFFFYSLMASISAISNMLTCYIPFNFKEDGRVSTSAGIIDSALYLGAAIAGPLIGSTSELFGWNGIFGGILGICLAAFIPCYIYFKTTSVLPKPPDSGLEKK